MLSRKAKAEEEEAPLSLPEALALELQEELGNDEVDQEYQDARQKMLKLFKLKEEVGSSVVTLTR